MLRANNSFSQQWLCNGKVTLTIRVDIDSKLNYLIIRYLDKREGKEARSINYVIGFTWINCNFGGKRPWFICPLKKCGRRVAILYGGPIFSCRHCCNLVYQSQRQTVCDRAILQARKLRNKLNWDADILSDLQEKPKGMHWRTFNRLCKKHKIYTNVLLAKVESFLDDL